MYNIILKSKKWLTINCAMNVAGGFVLGFYIFPSERIKDDYIIHCKPKTCMVV